MSITTSWQDIPSEIWFTILQKLPIKSQVSLGCTSKKFYLLSLDPLLFNLEERVWVYFKSQKPLPDLLAKAVTTLRIPAPQYGDKEVESQGRFIQEEIRRMSNLQTLVIENSFFRSYFLPASIVQEVVQQKDLSELKVPGFFLTYKSPTGKTLLHLAVEKGNKKLLLSLLFQMQVYFIQEGAKTTSNFLQELQASDAWGNTPVKIAMEQGDEEACTDLLIRGARGKEYLLSRENPDLSPIMKSTIDKGSHLQVEYLCSSDFPAFFEAIKVSRHLLSLSFSESFYRELKEGDMRASFFKELADALKQNGQNSWRIFLLDLKACPELTTQEIKPFFHCLELEMLCLPNALLQHVDESKQNLLHLLLHESFPSMNKKIAKSLIFQGMNLSAKDYRGRTPIQLAQELELKIGNKEMALFLEQSARSKIDRIAFGKKEWEKYYGKVGKEPPLPDTILEILESSCPFIPGKKICSTHFLTLIPEKVDGKPFTLDYLRDLVEKPRGGGNVTSYQIYGSRIREEHGSTPSGSSYWVLMTKQVLPITLSRGGYNELLQELDNLAAKVPKVKGLGEYKPPKILEAATSILMEYTRIGLRFYSDSEGCSRRETHTYCEEVDSKYKRD